MISGLFTRKQNNLLAISIIKKQHSATTELYNYWFFIVCVKVSHESLIQWTNRWIESMNRIHESNQWIEAMRRVYESSLELKQCIEPINRISEPNLWTESMNRINESNQWIESMNIIYNSNRWIESMSRPKESKQIISIN